MNVFKSFHLHRLTWGWIQKRKNVPPKHTLNVTTWLHSLRTINGDKMDSLDCKLRLVQVQINGESQPKVCVSLGNEQRVVDITKIDPSIPCDMKSFLEGGKTTMAAAARYTHAHLFSLH